MYSFAILACLISTAVAMSTTRGHHHHTGPTHSPDRNEAFVFHYNAQTQTMAVKTHRHCYLYTLSSAEHTSVHTNTGLHSIEKTMIDLIDAHGSFSAVSLHDLTTMSHDLSHFCGHLTTMKIN
uniref:Uncharacterized protein n=1 Tax=Magallana gigas TaxID=29159 RepID=A0A8W8LE23_MAGGI|nr:uncharacterized protein LOC105319543 [Crassostrea gigas]